MDGKAAPLTLVSVGTNIIAFVPISLHYYSYNSPKSALRGMTATLFPNGKILRA